MDDDLLNPIDINLDDYEDEGDTESEPSAQSSAEEGDNRQQLKPALPANPVPDPAELDRLLSGAPPEEKAAGNPAPNPAPSSAANPAPAAPRSGVPPLPDASDITLDHVAPPETPMSPAQEDVVRNASGGHEDDDDMIVETGDHEDDDIRPIDVMAPHNGPSQFGGAPPAVPELPDLPVNEQPEEVSNIDVSQSGDHQSAAAATDAPKEELVDDDNALAKPASINRVSLGEEVNLTRMDPGLKRVMIGMGWDAKVFSDDSTPDLDVSLFLLNKDERTRENEDFVFYNNMEACEGGVKHHGDNRTGAGDGDDENITIKLSDLPFDIVGMEVVLTIYQGLEKEQSFKDVENIFFRLVNADTQIELMRLELDTVVGAEKAVGVKIGRFNRIGPNWFFEASATPIPKGLAECATEYGIVVAEMT